MSEESERPGFAAVVSETLLWWLITYVVWLATLSSFTTSELAVAAACTLPCAVIVPVARRANGGNWRFRSGWLKWWAVVARDVPVQTIEAWRYALSRGRRHAELTAVPLPTEDDPTAAGRRATSTLCFATTPGTVVCDSDARLGRVLLHRLGQQQGRLEEAVQR